MPKKPKELNALDTLPLADPTTAPSVWSSLLTGQTAGTDIHKRLNLAVATMQDALARAAADKDHPLHAACTKAWKSWQKFQGNQALIAHNYTQLLANTMTYETDGSVQRDAVINNRLMMQRRWNDYTNACNDQLQKIIAVLQPATQALFDNNPLFDSDKLADTHATIIHLKNTIREAQEYFQNPRIQAVLPKLYGMNEYTEDADVAMTLGAFTNALSSAMRCPKAFTILQSKQYVPKGRRYGELGNAAYIATELFEGVEPKSTPHAPFDALGTLQLGFEGALIDLQQQCLNIIATSQGNKIKNTTRHAFAHGMLQQVEALTNYENTMIIGQNIDNPNQLGQDMRRQKMKYREAKEVTTHHHRSDTIGRYCNYVQQCKEWKLKIKAAVGFTGAEKRELQKTLTEFIDLYEVLRDQLLASSNPIHGNMGVGEFVIQEELRKQKRPKGNAIS
jgi:hypothetical protein